MRDYARSTARDLIWAMAARNRVENQGREGRPLPIKALTTSTYAQSATAECGRHYMDSYRQAMAGRLRLFGPLPPLPDGRPQRRLVDRSCRARKSCDFQPLQDGTPGTAAHSWACLGELRQCGRALRFVCLRLSDPLHGDFIDIPASRQSMWVHQLRDIVQLITHTQGSPDEAKALDVFAMIPEVAAAATSPPKRLE